MANTESIGDRLRRLRDAAGLTQAELADAAGISRPSLNEIETGITARPRRGTLLKIAAALGVAVETLQGRQLAAAPKGPFLPGGDVGPMGATVVPRGGLAAALGADFGEDDGTRRGAPAPTTAREFIDGLIKEADGLRAQLAHCQNESKKLSVIIAELQESQRTSLQHISLLLGKPVGSQYDSLVLEPLPEPARPVVRGLWRDSNAPIPEAISRPACVVRQLIAADLDDLAVAA
ncbi:helix-turn-helix transcriptional regulator [Hymenobacter lapidiphilus]|uniref:Helix-turn-helix transcriptional regulator n=1 Tax=Hymenobacter lapidiphilus TaxID=2608003 RepID=A0A7Y7U5X5_9BACT|nr:helix-turn-helix transcriptional regulator [Hymenobacter lapidiphilus]NVO31199.1 helix-turn-helix transcriptional regulator [Hymenobacter lapidiphilus]